MTEQPRIHPYSGSAKIFRWYDLPEDDQFQCECGWTGSFMDLSREMFEELVDGSCPSCERMLAIRSYPTIPEISAAAEAGDPKAAEQLESIEESARSEGSKSP